MENVWGVFPLCYNIYTLFFHKILIIAAIDSETMCKQAALNFKNRVGVVVKSISLRLLVTKPPQTFLSPAASASFAHQKRSRVLTL